MTILEYFEKIKTLYNSGRATEHSYRGALAELIESIVSDIVVTNEPHRIECGAPDYIITKKNIPVGYIEAKDIPVPLDKTEKSEQLIRYLSSLPNLILTDYIEFRLFREGEKVTTVNIARNIEGDLIANQAEWNDFENLIKDFCTHVSQTIRSASKLAKMMAGKARMLSQVIENALTSDEKNEADSSLKDQMTAFKNILIHDIKPKEFADIYAQTIAYGMFAARLHDHTLENFSRQEAAELIPKTNPFLRRLFGYIAGPDIDDRIIWIVDDLADIFRATDVAALLKNFGKTTQKSDPIIHFYETFLSEYDPKLRKSRGVWYTPEPVVNFIVRAVDVILKKEFGIKDGLADTSKTKVKINIPTHDKSYQQVREKDADEIEQEVHKVQILDPAAGTGTFLAEIVKHIYKKFEGQQGIWSQYVENQLIPRLNGFEILMASYAMAHLKLDLLLTETGYKPKKDQRFRIYLTNSLEEHHPDTGTLFASWLSSEANEANHIKRDTPVMCVIGNPPYSGESSNKGDWIMSLMEDYKKEPGGKEKLKERNPKWINGDENKFIRYGQHFIEKNGSGILAFINPHSFLDNPTFRGMRWHLLKTFDKIYTIDLHGNSTKKETAPDGSADANVFDIMQGVSINIFVKTGKKKSNELGKVFHYDLYGKREYKYDFLSENSIKNVQYKELENVAPNYLFIQKDYALQSQYDKGLSINDLFLIKSVSVATHRDNLVIAMNNSELNKRINTFCDINKTDNEIYAELNLKDNRDWKLPLKRKLIIDDNQRLNKITKIDYRLFDTRAIFYHKDAIDFRRENVMKNMLVDNLALVINRQCRMDNYQHVFISNKITELHIMETANACPNHCPLYLYPETIGQQTIDQSAKRTPNLKTEIVEQFEEKLKLTFANEKETRDDTFAPIDLLDYIYSILHSPTYRKKYKEFLKIDFPRVPYPKDQNTFWKLVKLGGELRQIHLLESSKVEKYITKYPQDGDNTITRKIGKKDFEITNPEKGLGRVWINDEQYFDKVPIIAWEFYIGGYQPAQKWLKDRKERQLSFDDILHYQKIIVALTETDRIMKEIDKVKFE